jgi:hypothetical protein
MTDFDSLISAASRVIKAELGDANVTFFLHQTESFELYMFPSDNLITAEKSRLEDCFDAELVEAICKANKLCTLDDMFAIGLRGDSIKLRKTSAATIPLSDFGCSLGFILIWRPAQDRLQVERLRKICAVAHGLARAIKASRVAMHSAD